MVLAIYWKSKRIDLKYAYYLTKNSEGLINTDRANQFQNQSQSFSLAAANFLQKSDFCNAKWEKIKILTLISS